MFWIMLIIIIINYCKDRRTINTDCLYISIWVHEEAAAYLFSWLLTIVWAKLACDYERFLVDDFLFTSIILSALNLLLDKLGLLIMATSRWTTTRLIT